jgi:uncharacterized protein
VNRKSAVELLNRHIKNERMIAHSLASEAVMKSVARRLGRDEDAWALAGLLHDLDVEITNADLKVHGLEAEKILRAEGIDADIIDAIVMHNELAHSKKRTTEFQHALAAAETVTGLIVATALVYPDKKLSSVKSKSVVKRMKEKAFAASVNRQNIMECEEIGIPLNEFVELAVDAMKDIAPQLGL